MAFGVVVNLPGYSSEMLIKNNIVKDNVAV